jgi:two-component system alkaline phosphatase synthesis response regulator PhoP
MNKIAHNILNILRGKKKETFTKDEVIKIVNDTCGDERLPTIESNGVVVNTETHLVTCNGKDHFMPKREFDLLYYFIANKDTIITRKQILSEVWGNDVCVGERTIDVHIRRIRTIIPFRFIETNKGVGYRWVEKK